jgi:hypothetical protein
MRCGQAAKMPDAVSVVRAATTPSAIAPFETTESGRELGQAEPLMAPWWKLADRTATVHCANDHNAARAVCRARTAVLPRNDAGWQCICEAGGGRCGGVEHVSRLILQHCADRRSQHRICLGQCWCSSETVLISAAKCPQAYSAAVQLQLQLQQL